MALNTSAALAALKKAAELASDPNVRKAAKFAVENSKQIGQAVEFVTPYVKKAAEAGMDAGAKAAQAGKETGVKAAHAGKETANGIAKKAREAAERAGESVKNAAEEHAENKALSEARQQLLKSASMQKTAADFAEEWATATEAGLIRPLKTPGYYVIAVYKNKPRSGALDKYDNLYVGCAQDAGASIYEHLTGFGNPDIYADFKYKQHLVIYLYPDSDIAGGDTTALDQFMLALDAKESYNARDLADEQDADIATPCDPDPAN